MTLTQEFEGPGEYSETAEWYRRRLELQGWRLFDPNERRHEWCKAPWMVRVEESAAYPGNSPPQHRYTLRLEWDLRFTADRCPFPG